MRIALVNPIARNTAGYHSITSKIPHLGLQVLGQLTPDEHQVELYDEIFGSEMLIKKLKSQQFDLVGITAMTSGATRAYELARLCRTQGIPTVFGGIHASTRPDEAQEHVDAVAIGECDSIWTNIIADVASNQLKPRYMGSNPQLEAGVGIANQRLQPQNGDYDVACLQTSRGCPVGCRYCSVTQFNGAAIRRRPIDEIIAEWNTIQKRFIFVVDDNFFGVGPSHAKWAREFLKQLAKDGKRHPWFSQTTLNMGDDDEGLELAYKAGCRAMLIGFETFNKQQLKDFHKGINRINVERYSELVSKFHNHGIAVFGGFIIGGEGDNPETAMTTLNMAMEIGVDIIQITNLTPLPGTGLFDQFESENRLLAPNYPVDWERHTFIETVYKPSTMTPAELDRSIYELRASSTGWGWVFKRTFKTLLRTRSLSTAAVVHSMNTSFMKLARYLAARDHDRFEGGGYNGSDPRNKVSEPRVKISTPTPA